MTHDEGMDVDITIPAVPLRVRNQLAARAAARGQSLSEYLRAILMGTVGRHSTEDVIARTRARVRRAGAPVSAEAILAARDHLRR